MSPLLKSPRNVPVVVKPRPGEVSPLVETAARVLDELFHIPGTRYKVGLDGLLGLIPGVGDAITLAAAYLMLREAQRLNVPHWVRGRMIGNYAIDFLVGLIP